MSYLPKQFILVRPSDHLSSREMSTVSNIPEKISSRERRGIILQLKLMTIDRRVEHSEVVRATRRRDFKGFLSLSHLRIVPTPGETLENFLGAYEGFSSKCS